MNHIKSEHIIKELLFNIKHKDLIKARLVIEHIEMISSTEQRRLLYELNKCDDDFAVPLLAIMTVTKKNLVSKHPAIKEALLDKILMNPQILITEIKNRTPELILYIQLVGDFNIDSAVPALIDVITESQNEVILEKTILSLGEIGCQESVNNISNFLRHKNQKLVFGAVLALGKIGTSTAMQRLAERLGDDERVNVQILNVFAHVQDQISLQKLNETLQYHSAHLRNYALSKLIKIGSKAIPMLLENFKQNDPDLHIHTLTVLGNIGDESATLALRKFILSEPKDPNVRFLAYETLQKLPKFKGSYVLANGLSDPDNNVRLAAARAIEKNYNDILSTGMKNLVSGDDEESKNISKVIIDAQTGKICLDLLSIPQFKKIFVDYVGNQVYIDTRKFYIKVLDKNNQAEIRDDILKLSGKKPQKLKKQVCAVDDSGMILKIYQKVLHGLGYEPVLFQKPEKALKWLESNKPAILCTDLNMPNITGIEVIERTRIKYSKKDLPIILVTTQNELTDNDAAKNAGVTEIINKPFTSEKLKAAFDRTR